MNTFEQRENDIAYQLLSLAIDYVEAYVADEDDWDAAVVAVLARAIELASGSRLKDLEDCFVAKGELYERK